MLPSDADVSRMSLLEKFAFAIERDDANEVGLLLASSSVDVNARLPRDKRPPA